MDACGGINERTEQAAMFRMTKAHDQSGRDSDFCDER
jgi:hypothetical protein